MSNTTNKPNMTFWIIGILALLWNLAGISQFFPQAMNSESWRANFTPEMLEIIDGLPLWYTLVFAVAVFGSTLACILLLAKRKLAVPLFFVGMLAVVTQSGFNLFVNEVKQYYSTFQVIITILLPIISAALYFYARRCADKGWLS